MADTGGAGRCPRRARVARAGKHARQDLVLENLLLRHQLAVLTRPTRRRSPVRLRLWDKLLWILGADAAVTRTHPLGDQRLHVARVGHADPAARLAHVAPFDDPLDRFMGRSTQPGSAAIAAHQLSTVLNDRTFRRMRPSMQMLLICCRLRMSAGAERYRSAT